MLFSRIGIAFLLLPFALALALSRWDPLIRSPTDDATTWAVLVAGSSGFANYRHQADVCHAYQILRKGGVKDDNIIVFMYDDIANNELNPRKGVIINHPNGSDVYAGVPKDYTGEQVSAHNFYAVLLGNKSAVQGGSGKVVNTKSNDRIFLFYSDHGGPGVLGMPNQPYVYADEFIDVLKKMHDSQTYKEMVMYIEACESGSMFEGLLPDNLNIYVTTASNADESSWGTYCPGSDPSPPPEYSTCLGDLYSVAWMEDSEGHNLKKESIAEQYEKVKDRTSNHYSFNGGSHVMEYGTKDIKSEMLYLYQGFDPKTEDFPTHDVSKHQHHHLINQRDADLLFLWERYKKLEEGSKEKSEVLELISEATSHRAHLDRSMERIRWLLFGSQSVLKSRGGGFVDDWDCLRSMVGVFEKHCGSLGEYGMKHMRALANICNEGVLRPQMDKASITACNPQSSST